VQRIFTSSTPRSIIRTPNTTQPGHSDSNSYPEVTAPEPCSSDKRIHSLLRRHMQTIPPGSCNPHRRQKEA
jgi:hypothetical protein